MARSVELDCQAAFQKIWQQALTTIHAQHEKACESEPEAIHQIRIALTRMRAVRSFFASMMPAAGWPALKTDIAWINGRLGAVRDDDVMDDFARRKNLREWAARVDMAGYLKGNRHRRRLAKALRSSRYRNLLAALAQWGEAGPWLAHPDAAKQQERTAPVQAYAERKLRQWRQWIVRKGRDVSMLDSEARHDLRIKAKRYRYMVESLAALEPSLEISLQGSGKPARRLQHTLGELRDLRRFRRLGGRHARLPGYKRMKKRLLRRACAAIRSL